MVSCLMGDSTALASAIVRCCLKCVTFTIKKVLIRMKAFEHEKRREILG